jgi:hypothetical protein
MVYRMYLIVSGDRRVYPPGTVMREASDEDWVVVSRNGKHVNGLVAVGDLAYAMAEGAGSALIYEPDDRQREDHGRRERA